MDKPIETTQLQVIVAVANAMSFSKAAMELGVTQSAVSQSVKALETRIGVSLVQRRGKEVVLTPEGAEIVSTGRKVLKAIGRSVLKVQEERDEMKGTLRVGTLPGIGKSWLSNRLIHFAHKYPQVVVNARLDNASELIKEYDNNQLDCLIVSQNYLPTRGEKQLLFREYINLVYPCGHRFEGHLSLEELTKIPLICFEQNDVLFSRWCTSHFGKIPPNLKPHFIMNSHGTMLHGVKKGIGMAVMPTHVVSRSSYKDKISCLSDKYAVVNNDYYLLAREEGPKILRIKTFMDFIFQEASEDVLIDL